MYKMSLSTIHPWHCHFAFCLLDILSQTDDMKLHQQQTGQFVSVLYTEHCVRNLYLFTATEQSSAATQSS